jgi:transcription elongation factor GreA
MAADKLTYISQEGVDKLKAEMEMLKTVKRPEIVERISAAKALGDLSENAEYHDAKEALAIVQGRIYEITELLKNVFLIDASKAGGVIQIGSTVNVTVNGKNRVYKIVGVNEADPVNGLISNESPLGNAFLGQKEGESVTVQTPGGTTTYVIASVT